MVPFKNFTRPIQVVFLINPNILETVVHIIILNGQYYCWKYLAHMATVAVAVLDVRPTYNALTQ